MLRVARTAVRFRSAGSRPARVAQRGKFNEPPLDRPSSDQLSAVQALVAASKTGFKERNPLYFDPENSTLDLSLPNAEILNRIRTSSQKRMEWRYGKPANEWSKKNIKGNLNAIREKFTTAIGNATISPRSAGFDPQVGDLVILKLIKPTLYMIVGIPSEFGSVLYTYVNNEGDIVYKSSRNIMLRFPGVIPQDLKSIVELVVCLEEKMWDIAPVGIPDGKFSRSEAARPKKGEYKQEDETPQEDMPFKGEDISESSENKFMVTQASSKMFVNSDIHTHIVPVTARSLFSAPLTELSMAMSRKMPEMRAKLLILHDVLQYDVDGETLNSPKTVGVFELLKFTRFISGTENTAEVRAKLRQKINREFEDPSSGLGKDMFESYVSEKYPIADFGAFILALELQNRFWKISQNSSKKVPIAVHVLPYSHTKLLEQSIEILKTPQEVSTFCNYVVSKVADPNSQPEKPRSYEAIVQVLKDYIIENFKDPVAETAIITVIRAVDMAMVRSGYNFEPVANRNYEYSKNRAYEILQLLGEFSWENPARWSYSFQTPKYASLKATLDSEYYDCVNLAGIDASNEDIYTTDPYLDVRQDFGNTPVFCIDSANAHEIDDGISVHEESDKYVFTVHVANPASYIKPGSELDKIAFGRGTTHYIPDGLTMMLPEVIVRNAGLERSPSRTFAVQYSIEKKLLQDFRSGKNPDTDSVKDQIESSVCVKLFTAQNLPKGYTYDRVNEILQGSDDVYKDSLETLYSMAKLLKTTRQKQGGLELGSLNSSVVVKFKPPLPENDRFEKTESGYRLQVCSGNSEVYPEITVLHKDGSSKADLLVTEFMISGNSIVPEYATQNQIKMIHRVQSMKLHKNVAAKIDEITAAVRSGKEISVEHQRQIMASLRSASYAVEKAHHESMGISGYATVTSPLRRYVDLVNQQQVCDFIVGTKSTRNLEYITGHLNARDAANKKFMTYSNSFWTAVFFEEYMRLRQLGKLQPILFKLLVTSSPSFGDMSVRVLGFLNISSCVESSAELVEEFDQGKFEIGSVIEDYFDIVLLDYVEGNLVLKRVKSEESRGEKKNEQ